MQIRYHEDLIEEVVFLAVSGCGSSVPGLQVTRFHREREKCYGILDPDERSQAFFTLYLSWFREWGFEARITRCVNEFPVPARRSFRAGLSKILQVA